MNLSSFDALKDLVKSKKRIRIAAAGPAKGEVLESLKWVYEEGLAELTFIGDTAWIFQMANRAGLNMSKIEMIHESELELPAARVAVEQAKKGKAQVLMNGYVSSSHMLQAAMDSFDGFNTGRAYSQLTAIKLPGSPRLLFIADTGLNARPGAMEKRDILLNSLEYLKNLGFTEIRVAILKGILLPEMNVSKNSSRQSVPDEMALLENLMDDFPGLVLLGPLSLEDAMKGEAPDLYFVPNADAGQLFSQSLQVFAQGQVGNIILGGTVPFVLTTYNPTVDHIKRSILMASAGAL